MSDSINEIYTHLTKIANMLHVTSCALEILIYLKLSCLSQYIFHESTPLSSPCNHMYSPPCIPLSAGAKRGKGEDFKKIDYKEIKKHTQEQRANQTDPEKLLREELRGRKLDNKQNVIQ